MDTSDNGKFELLSSSMTDNFKLLVKALDSSVSGIVITDNSLEDNPIVYCNAAFEAISGYPRNEIIGHNCRFLQADDRSQKERDQLRESIKNGKDCFVEIRNYRKNGDLFWNELYMAPVKDPDGNITHFIGVQNDVSKRKAVEQDLRQQKAIMEQRVEDRTMALRDSEAFLTSIIETVREGLLVLDPDFKVLSANQHFLKTFKVNAEETVGVNLYALGNNQWDIARLRDLLLEILPTSNPVVDFEVEHDFPHIGKKLMLLNAYRIELEGQFKDQILLAIEDITDRREIERRKDDFLSIASHELKTPLTTIKGYMQILERSIPEQASEKFTATLGKISAYVERLNNLISELLDVSKIQTGNITLHKADFDFDKMVLEVIEGIGTSAPRHKILLQGRSESTVHADESHIVQVLNNLLSNAIKYAPESLNVEVSVSSVSDFVKVSVRDFGLGMNAEDKKRAFERFYRSSEVQKRFSGMGIGLYICDQIIQNHNGTLWVDSEKGKGSTFSFTLPKNKVQDNGR
ncbi:PAS domain-containing sensor histidine kinase [Pedobacter jeongneungensis]|uniref:sensor histidine kinase n=1 Tax=Pedobacter jeongneungensis TaxID=947309 RepID=UPI001F0589BE|nr:PAS domain-containing sensor histidine kinase [Pedobacter jeongneungensis]